MFSLCISPSKFLHVIPHSAHVSQPLPGKIWWHNTLYSVDHLKASSDRKTIGSTKSKHSLLLWPNSAGKHLQTVVISINEIQCEIQSSFHVDTHGHRGNFDGVISLHREHICRGSHAIVDATLINPVTLTSIETPLIIAMFLQKTKTQTQTEAGTEWTSKQQPEMITLEPVTILSVITLGGQPASQ